MHVNVCEPNYTIMPVNHINVELRKSCNQLIFYTEERVTQQGQKQRERLRKLKG